MSNQAKKDEAKPAAAGSENSDILKQLEAAQKTISELQTEASALKSENSALKSQQASSAQTIQDASRSCNALEAALEEAKINASREATLAANVRGDLAAANRNVDELRARLEATIAQNTAIKKGAATGKLDPEIEDEIQARMKLSQGALSREEAVKAVIAQRESDAAHAAANAPKGEK